jgi:haloalkane dehalogenase
MRSQLISFLNFFLLLQTSVSFGSNTFGYEPLSQQLQKYDESFLQKNAVQIINVQRDGHDIHARFFENKDKKNSPLVVAAHGFPDSLHLYDKLAPLIQKQLSVVTFDFLGWGRSAKPTGNFKYNSLGLKADLDSVIKAASRNQNQKVILICHDISAFPVIDWALENQDRVAHLVILNSVYHRTENLFPPQGIFLFGSNEAKYAREYLTKISISKPSFFQAMVEEQLTRFMSTSEAREKFTPIFVAQAKNIMPAFFQLNSQLVEEVTARTVRVKKGDLKRFKNKVSIIFGEDDPYLTKGLGADFTKEFPNSELHLIPGAGHYVQLDKAENTAEIILNAASKN